MARRSCGVEGGRVKEPNLEAIAQAFYAMHVCVESIAISHASIAHDVKRLADAVTDGGDSIRNDVEAIRREVEDIRENGVRER